MGCWNGTCGISQLPITAGTKVKTFILLQSEFDKEVQGSGQCYSTAYFRPWFLPVTAEYNDYGSIKNIEMDWHAEYMLQTFQQLHKDGQITILGDDAEINSPNVDKFETLENVFDCIERGALVFDYHRRGKEVKGLKVGLFMVLEPVYNKVLAEAKRQLTLKHNKYWADRLKEDRDAALQDIQKYRATMEKGDKDKNLIGVLYSMNLDNFLGGLIEEHAVFKHYKNLLFDPKCPIAVDAVMEMVDEIGYIRSAMSYLRKYWIPQCGQGSQSEELDFNRALICGMQNHIEEREKQFAKWKAEEKVFMKKYKAEQAAKKKKGKK